MSAKIAAEDMQNEPVVAENEEKTEKTQDEVDMAKKYGPPLAYDKKFKGPIEKRSCTDVLCLLLLIIFLAGWAVIAFIAISQGDPSNLIYPIDSLGQKCGYDEKVKDKKFLYFFDITKCAELSSAFYGCRTPQVCVESCPTQESLGGGPWSLKSAMNKRESIESSKQKMICKYGVDLDKITRYDDLQKLVKTKKCTSFVLPSRERNSTKKVKFWRKNPVKNIKSILARRCIPMTLSSKDLDEIDVKAISIQKGLEKLLEFLNAKENIEAIFNDLKASWHVILILLVAGTIASLIWICLMRFVAGIMVWSSLVGMIGVLSFSCYFSVAKYISFNNEQNEHAMEMELRHTENGQSENEVVNVEDIEWESQVNTFLKLKNTWLAFSIMTGSILGILLLVIIFLRARLSIAVALIKQGARAVSDMVFTLLWPVAPWIGQIAVIAYFIVVGVYLTSATEEVYQINQNCTCGPETFIENQRCSIAKISKLCPNETSSFPDDNNCNILNACQFIHMGKLSHVFWFHIYNFFGLLWLLCFISDFGDMVLAGSFARWYWTFNRKKDLKMFPVSAAFFRTIRYHLGTVAFGSLIISIIKFIRFFLEYVDQKLKQYNQDNPVTKALLCCCKCCFWCLESFMKFINRNAYIMCSVYGKNFCTSARDSFFLLMRNAVRAFVLDKVTDFLLFMGKLVIIGGVSIGSFFFFTQGHEYFEEEWIPELNFYFIPVIIIAIGTYFITTLFFSVYNMSVDTLFLCFLEDCERNDGSEEKPYYMPKELMEILGKKNMVKKSEKK